jgi:pimeloyl-ACP methyl ester carboxylesterase
MSEASRPRESVVDVQGIPTLVREGGRGAPILFLHGPEDPAWAPGLARLAEGFRVVAPDHPGMGRTPLGPDIDAMDDVVYHYLDLIETLALGEATVVGASFGGWVAAELALRLGPRLKRLVLVDAAGLRVGGTDVAEIYLMSDDELARFLVMDARHAELVFPPSDDLAVVERRLVQRATLARLTWVPYWHDPKLLGRLRRITAQTLVLWGGDDRFIPPTHAKEFGARIPRASVRVIEGAGHLPHLEQPDRFAEAVAKFHGSV